jgi:hypothetical protein
VNMNRPHFSFPFSVIPVVVAWIVRSNKEK